MSRRDIIVVGGSAGGMNALQALVERLPPRFPATVLVVLHIWPEMPTFMPAVFRDAGHLPAALAVDGERFQRGRIHIAPPDHHLLVEDTTLRVTRGPRENGFRPAVDPLFRSAANHHGPRVIGIVLSGGLDDGTHGLQCIKQRGGIAIVQHVEEAAVPGMPLSAIQNVEVDHILRVRDMGVLLTRLVREKIAAPIHSAPKQEDAVRGARHLRERPQAPASSFTCPECGGALWLTAQDQLESFRCHVGHTFTAAALDRGLDQQMERALWTALRTLEEQSAFQRRLAERARAQGLTLLVETHEKRARESEKQAAVIQRVLTRVVPKPTAARRRRAQARRHEQSRSRRRSTRRTR